MPNPYFQFKRFTVFHDKCAMKVGTDGVLLGSWVKLADDVNVLDIGTGTGLIALMLSQRSESKMAIDGIDIDSSAVLQARENADRSPFDNINCTHISLQEYVSVCSKKYDLIVSNPPYFTSSLHSPSKRRTLARHDDSLEVEELINISSRLLSERGRLSIIFPFSEKDELIAVGEATGLSISRITNVYPTATSHPKRVLMEFSVKRTDREEDNLIIEKERHVYSDEFTALTKDFYLNL